MSAKDDAVELVAPRPRLRLWPTVIAGLTGALIAAVAAVRIAPRDLARFEARLPWDDEAPRSLEWPRARLAGERVELVTDPLGPILRVTGAQARETQALAAGLAARRTSGWATLAETRSQLREAWANALPAGAPVPLDARESTAALLLGRASQIRDLARLLPSPYDEPAPGVAAPQPPLRVLERNQELELAARAKDPEATEAALTTGAALEADWFAAGVPSRGASHGTRGAAWRRYQLQRADSLEALAVAVLGAGTDSDRERVEGASRVERLRLDQALPDPWSSLAASGESPRPPAIVPIWRTWAMLLGAGASIGFALVLAVAWCMSRLRAGRVSLDGAPSMRMPDPATPGPLLHVVSGPTPRAIGRAVLELAAHALARHERVLIVDGGWRLRLHERLGREARWGLMECLSADMPVLGLVQYGGRPGLYLLAHGNPARGEGWSRLGQRLDESSPHFNRLILALDLSAPGVIAQALAGRPLEAWWADSAHRLPEAAIELTGRLGIPFSGMRLSDIHDVTLEALSGRVDALTSVGVGLTTTPQVAAWAPAEEAPAAAVEVVRAAPDPIVLDCDLQVRQRLRFLAWMRRVQAEQSRVEEQAPEPMTSALV